MMPRLSVQNVAKTFTMHLRDGVVLPVVTGVSFDVEGGEKPPLPLLPVTDVFRELRGLSATGRRL